MLAVQFDEPGPADVLRVNDVPEPSPGAGEIVVEFEASTINPADEKIRNGSIPPRKGSAPWTLGYDLVGVVAGRGPGADRYAVGTRVIGMSAMAITGHGVWSELVCLKEASVARAPEGVDPGTAAQLPLAGLTGYQAIQALAPEPGATVLVAGAAGAIGRLAAQILRHRGIVVHALVRNSDQAAALPTDAVDDVHIGGSGDLVFDAVLDTVGADFSGALRDGGHYLSIVPGALPSRSAPTMEGRKAKVIVTRESGALLDELARMVERFELRLPEPVTFALTDVHRAHAEFEERTGRRVALVR
jgi:NADPH:quinone reductase-like Zn-dependent oxidoreductase